MPFDPYHKWLGIRSPERPPNHYRLLGLEDFESDSDVIASAADRQMSHIRRYQSGVHAEESQRLLNEVASARLCLLNCDAKDRYDERLANSRLSLRESPEDKPPSTHVLHNPLVDGDLAEPISAAASDIHVTTSDTTQQWVHREKYRRRVHRTAFAACMLLAATVLYWSLVEFQNGSWRRRDVGVSLEPLPRDASPSSPANPQMGNVAGMVGSLGTESTSAPHESHDDTDSYETGDSLSADPELAVAAAAEGATESLDESEMIQTSFESPIAVDVDATNKSVAISRKLVLRRPELTSARDELDAVSGYLVLGKLDRAEAWLDQLAKRAANPRERDVVQRFAGQIAMVGEFWRSVDDGLARLREDDWLQLGDQRVRVVAIEETTIVVAGAEALPEHLSMTPGQMPFELALSLMRLGSNRTVVGHQILAGAYLAACYQVDRELATELGDDFESFRGWRYDYSMAGSFGFPVQFDAATLEFALDESVQFRPMAERSR